MEEIIKNEIITIETYPFVKNTIEVLARGRGLTASEYAEQILMERLDALWESQRLKYD